MISVTGFSKSYGETLAVQDLSFEVAAGSILGMLGPNGAGKTRRSARWPVSSNPAADGF